jgi:hypothetical protein
VQVSIGVKRDFSDLPPMLDFPLDAPFECFSVSKSLRHSRRAVASAGRAGWAAIGAFVGLFFASLSDLNLAPLLARLASKNEPVPTAH